MGSCYPCTCACYTLDRFVDAGEVVSLWRLWDPLRAEADAAVSTTSGLRRYGDGDSAWLAPCVRLNTQPST